MLLITAFSPLAARKFLLPHVPGVREKLILNQLWGEVTLGISCLFFVVVEILSGAASSAVTSEQSGAVPIVLFIRKPSLIFFFLFLQTRTSR